MSLHTGVNVLDSYPQEPKEDLHNEEQTQGGAQEEDEPEPKGAEMLTASSFSTADASNREDQEDSTHKQLEAEVAQAIERLNKRHGYLIAKRIFDFVFSLLVMVVFCWLFAIIAIAIKVDDPKGPVIFKQTRVGKNGREFTMYKFRSMVTDAEERLAELQQRNEKSGPVFKMRDDPRVTRVGRFIRKTGLDELPQFANVFLGDMSVVGPRPPLPREVAEYGSREHLRLAVTPGMTCYWQTRRNRDNVSFEEWIDLDLLYICSCSAWTDLKLIVRTVGVVLTAQGS